jgi:hypothetical protein
VTRRRRCWIPSLALALAAAACGGGEPADVGSGGPGTDTQATLAIELPPEGAEVERSVHAGVRVQRGSGTLRVR